MSESDQPTLGPDPQSAARARSVITPPPSDGLPGEATPIPSVVGRYRILRLLGEGGMGAVYEAEQDFPHRTVALKIIRAGYADTQMLRRFETETQALGRLQHPGIAQIYDAGAAETPYGRQPYIAMELVRGQTMLAWCDEHRLTLRQRLELMAKICDAVQHAHQRGLIHRDLKPANILVGEDGQPKILDFGIARLTDSDAQATRQTSMGQIIGTLAYMSPEQVTGDPDELDTRSDVYTLGVILYELLAGKAPYEIGKQIHETVRTIREKEPTALRTINRTFRGDVETIVAKALEKDKTRRYGSAAELAADIRHYLRDEPIVARPASAAVQIRKFARRHKALVGGVAAVFAVLVLGVVASTWEAVQARRAQRRAQQETAVAQAVNDFLQKDLLGQASAYNQAKPDPNITVRTVLDQAAQSISGKFKGQPEVESAIRDTIGSTYAQLGMYPQAQQQLEAALALSRRFLGAQNPQTLAVMSRLGRLAYLRGQYAESERWFRDAWNLQRRALGPDNRATLYSLSNLAVALEFEGKYAEAEPLYTQALAMERRALGPNDPDTLNTMNGLAGLYVDEGQYPKSEALHREIVADLTRVRGADYPDTLRSMGNLAAVLNKEGKLPESEALDREVLETRRRVLGADHPDTLFSMANLATVYNQESKYSEAENLDRQVLAYDRSRLGSENPATLQAMQILALVFDKEGRLAESAALREQLFAIRRRVLGPEHPLTLASESDLADNYAFQGDYAKAESLYRNVVEADRRVIGASNPEILPAMDGLACTWREQGDYAQSARLFQDTLNLSMRVLGPLHPYTLGITSDFGLLCQKEGDYAQAIRYDQQAFDGMRRKMGLRSPPTADAEADLALAYLSEKRFAQAEPLAREALATDRNAQPDDWQRYRAEALLGESLAGQKKIAEAEPLLRGGYQGMLSRKDHIDVPDQYHLRLAHQWLVQLHQSGSHAGPAAEPR